MTTIQLYNFLDGHKKEILGGLTEFINREGPACKEMFGSRLEGVLENLFEGSVDFLVTDEIDSLDKLYRALAPALAVKGSRFIEAYRLPLMMESIIQRLLTDEYSKLDEEEAVQELNRTLERAMNVTHRAATQFLNVFQEYLQNRIDGGGSPLEAPQGLGIDLSKIEGIEPAEDS